MRPKLNAQQLSFPTNISVLRKKQNLFRYTLWLNMASLHTTHKMVKSVCLSIRPSSCLYSVLLTIQMCFKENISNNLLDSWCLQLTTPKLPPLFGWKQLNLVWRSAVWKWSYFPIMWRPSVTFIRGCCTLYLYTRSLPNPGTNVTCISANDYGGGDRPETLDWSPEKISLQSVIVKLSHLIFRFR